MAATLCNGRKWQHTELKADHAKRFREYCRDFHLNFETSDAGYGYTHFAVLVSEDELVNANTFLEGME